MKNKITELAKQNGADVIGFAPAERFEKDSPIFQIMPETKTVIGLGFRILRGIYRGIEEGSTYYQYTTMAVENMEETIMPMAQLKIAMMLEEAGYIASYWGGEISGARRHYYTLTDAGRAALARLRGEWISARNILDQLIVRKDGD